MGKLNFYAYLILRFYPTREISVNFLSAKIAWFTVHESDNRNIISVF